MPGYITPEGMKKIKEKVEKLKEEYPKVIERVSIAKEFGDLSENAEYHAAKEMQKEIEIEMSILRKKLALLKVIDSSTLPKDKIRFGAYVKLKNLDTNEIEKYRLVGIDESGYSENEHLRISSSSPIGKTLLGKEKGEKVTINVPAGEKKYQVLEIY